MYIKLLNKFQQKKSVSLGIICGENVARNLILG